MSLFGTGAVTFTGTQFTELSAFDANFSKQTGYTQDGILGAGGTYAIQNNGTGAAVYQYAATPPSASYSVWADIAKLSGNTGNGPRMGVCGRMAASADTFYYALYSHDLTNIRLFKRVAGVQTQLGSSYTYTLTGTAAKLELVMNGSAISVKLNDSVVIGPVTDTDITAAGRAGIYLFDMRETGVADAGSLDNFDAAALGGGASLTGSITLDNADPTGTLGLNPSTLGPSTLTLDALAPTGTLGIAPGTVTTLPFSRNTGSRPTGLSGIAIAILSDDANMTRLAGATSLSQDGQGRVVYSGAGLPAFGTSVLVVTREPDGKLGLERYTVQ